MSRTEFLLLYLCVTFGSSESLFDDFDPTEIVSDSLRHHHLIRNNQSLNTRLLIFFGYKIFTIFLFYPTRGSRFQ